MPFLQSSDLECVYEFSLTLPITLSTVDTTEAAESLLFEIFFADSSAFTERWAASNGGLANLQVSPWVRLLADQVPDGDSSKNRSSSSSSSAERILNDEGSVSHTSGDGSTDGSTASSTEGRLNDTSGEGSTATCIEGNFIDASGDASTAGSVDSNDGEIARRPLQREQTFNISAGLHGVHSCRVRGA